MPTEQDRLAVAEELRPALDMFPDVDLSEASIAMLRQIDMRAMPMPPLSPEQETVAREERTIPGPAGAPDLRVLLYTPPNPEPGRPALLDIHGGGYVMGVPEIDDPFNRTRALALGCTVLSVDYRLAPETRAPGSVEDCHAALVWLHGHAEDLGIDRSRIAVTGGSAGGGLAAALTILARKRGQVPICFVLLDSPMLDDRTVLRSDHHPACGAFVWTAERNRQGWSALLGHEPGGEGVPAIHAPGRETDFAGLPPACITVGALDLFVHEDLDYARRLMLAGVPTEVWVIPGAFHGFQLAGQAAPQVRALETFQIEALRRAFAG